MLKLTMGAAIAAVLVSSCALFRAEPETSDHVAEVDVDDACHVACENLRSPRVNCPEGHGSLGGASCVTVCIRASQLRPLPLACWAAARSSVEAKACGSLRCVR